MNSIVSTQIKPQKLGFNLAYNFLQTVVLDCVEEYARTHRSLDAVDFARHLESNEQARFVDYVKAKTDWPLVATDDALVGADDMLVCYENPEKFRELVDAALFRHFQNVLGQWEEDVAAILARSGYISKDGSPRSGTGIERYRYQPLVEGGR